MGQTHARRATPENRGRRPPCDPRYRFRACQLYAGRFLDRLLRPAVYRRRELARQLCRDRDVLDIGCGTARTALALCDAGARSVTGIDFSTEMIDRGRAIVAASPHRDRIALDVADFMQWSPGRTWPLVLALGVFEYFADLRACVAAVAPFVDDTLAFSVRRFTPLRGTVRAAAIACAGARSTSRARARSVTRAATSTCASTTAAPARTGSSLSGALRNRACAGAAARPS